MPRSTNHAKNSDLSVDKVLMCLKSPACIRTFWQERYYKLDPCPLKKKIKMTFYFRTFFLKTMSKPIEKMCILGLGNGRSLGVSSYIFPDGSKKHICSFGHNRECVFTMSTEEIYKMLKEVDYPDEEMPEYLLMEK